MIQVATTATPIVHKVPKPLALTHNQEWSCEPLVTPDHHDKVVMQQKTNVRRAYQRTKQRPQSVAATPGNNGVSALSAELQVENGSTMQPVSAAMELSTVTKDDNTDNPRVAKRPRVATVLTDEALPTTSVPTGIRKKQCQGCVHGDLLETKVMEPAHIKHYLKNPGFLEWARCAGECAETIKSIHLASPKTNLRYCDAANKGFCAPDNDVGKADLECGLILCAPCYAVREERYARESTTNGTGNNRRSSRRGNKR